MVFHDLMVCFSYIYSKTLANARGSDSIKPRFSEVQALVSVFRREKNTIKKGIFIGYSCRIIMLWKKFYRVSFVVSKESILF